MNVLLFLCCPEDLSDLRGVQTWLVQATPRASLVWNSGTPNIWGLLVVWWEYLGERAVPVDPDIQRAMVYWMSLWVLQFMAWQKFTKETGEQGSLTNRSKYPMRRAWWGWLWFRISFGIKNTWRYWGWRLRKSRSSRRPPWRSRWPIGCLSWGRWGMVIP